MWSIIFLHFTWYLSHLIINNYVHQFFKRSSALEFFKIKSLFWTNFIVNKLSIQEYPLNPKALSLGELYGEFDLATNEWTDGVLSSVMRQTCAGILNKIKNSSPWKNNLFKINVISACWYYTLFNQIIFFQNNFFLQKI